MYLVLRYKYICIFLNIQNNLIKCLILKYDAIISAYQWRIDAPK